MKHVRESQIGGAHFPGSSLHMKMDGCALDFVSPRHTVRHKFDIADVSLHVRVMFCLCWHVRHVCTRYSGTLILNLHAHEWNEAKY